VKFQIRYQHWVLATSVALVLAMTGIFLVTVFGQFRSMAEENARERFERIATQASSEIGNLVGGVGRFVSTQSHVHPVLFSDGRGINQDGLVATFISSIAVDENLFGHFIGLKNDEFVQVIGIRKNAKLIAALKAPDGSYFGLRHITLQADGSRLEQWKFLSEDRQLLGQNEGLASYAPSVRPWYGAAMATSGLAITSPYLFSSTGEIGVTVSEALPKQSGVFGTDIHLASLQKILAGLAMSPNSAIFMLDDENRVIAYNTRGELFGELNIAPLTDFGADAHPALQSLKTLPDGEGARIVNLTLEQAAAGYVVIRQRAELFPGAGFKVVALAPMADFLGPIERARRDVLIVAAALLLLLVPLAALTSRRVVKALVLLASHSERMKQLDFSVAPNPPASFLYEINALAEAQVVMHRSIKERASELDLAQVKLARLVENGLLLAKEQDRSKLLHHILIGAQEIAHCAAGTLFLKTEQNTLAFAMRTSHDPLPDFEVPLYHPDTGEPMSGFVSSYVALNNQTIIIDDVYSETRFDLEGTKHFSETSGFKTISMLNVPLSPRNGEVIGVIQLMNALDPQTGAVIPFPAELVSFVEALAAQSAVTLENHNLVEAQKVLMDSMIRIIASAIDAKSAYTGGHCERVPELAVMLAEEAQKVEEGSLADFRFNNEEEWREFRIGAWLHDCGKVTTPEFVVDKATKLETIYNRIHEIRTRFEILLRDANTERLEAILAGTPAHQADQVFVARKQQLVDDFAFLAECNMGGEFMAPELVDRMKRIGAQTWLRHFDDRLGISQEELRRYRGLPPAELPVVETLLADHPWHLVERTDMRALDPKYGFNIKVPEYLYNFGEVHNLAIARGTLCDEERFKINEHIIQTVVMLDNMPFPKHLKRVPEYASTHHETLIGTGYPRKLSQSELSVPSRIMAIADIFEALTASDRPYKKAKTLSESVKILSFFKKDKHIDADLFDLFLTSGVYLRYGERYLLPEQMDAVDITQFIG
jgi:HD-GYP domain-containing protein (c-di-GMP phosphodiesterase class II)